MPKNPSPTRRPRSSVAGGRLAGPLTIALAGAAMLAWTWGTWPNVLVDFGRELYVPWRLTEGEVLYRDIAYFTGPLSPYLNALWFRLLFRMVMPWMHERSPTDCSCR